MRLRVRALNGQTTVIEALNPQDTVATVKQRLGDTLQIPPKLQRLIFSGKELEDNARLMETDIKEDGVIHLVVRAPTEITPKTGFTPIEHQGDPRTENLRNSRGLGLRASSDGVQFDLEASNTQQYVTSASGFNARHEEWIADPQVYVGLKQSRFIKLFAFLDILFILVAGMSGTHPLIFLAALLPVAGYYGVKSMNQILMGVYFAYLIFAAVFRFILLAAAIRGHKAGGLVILFLTLGFFFEVRINLFECSELNCS
jgi:hypothetical protein